MVHKYPGAVWRPITRNYTPRKRKRTDLVVNHVAGGEARSLYAWFMNRAARASSHVYFPREGRPEQYVDLDTIAWGNGSANSRSIIIETQGGAAGEWNAHQVRELIKFWVYVHRHYGVPLRAVTTSKRVERGIAHHRLGVPATYAQKRRGVSQTGGELWSSAVGKVCFPTDITDVLTDTGWKPLLDVTDTDRVASVAEDGTTTFDVACKVEPFISETVTVGRFESTPDHQWVVKASGPSRCLECDFEGKRRAVGVHRQHSGHEVERSDIWKKIPATEVKRTDILLSPAPRVEGLPLTLDQVRMAVWLYADGHYISENGSTYHGVEWHFKKRRKTDRVAELLETLGVEYSRGSRADGTEAIRVWGDQGRALISLLPTKRFTTEWINVSAEQIEAMWAELKNADGASTEKSSVCFSTDKASLEIIQAASINNGIEASMWFSGGLWWLRRRQRPARLAGAVPARVTEVACLTTKNGTLIIRQRGHVAVSGNCPGPDRIKQIPGMIAQAQKLAAGNAPAPTPKPAPAKPASVSTRKFQQDINRYAKAGLIVDDVNGPVTRAWRDWTGKLQAALNEYKSDLPPLRVDDHYGWITARKVTEIQRRNGLVPDGMVGPIMIAWMRKQGSAIPDRPKNRP